MSDFNYLDSYKKFNDETKLIFGDCFSYSAKDFINKLCEEDLIYKMSENFINAEPVLIDKNKIFFSKGNDGLAFSYREIEQMFVYTTFYFSAFHLYGVAKENNMLDEDSDLFNKYFIGCVYSLLMFYINNLTKYENSRVDFFDNGWDFIEKPQFIFNINDGPKTDILLVRNFLAFNKSKSNVNFGVFIASNINVKLAYLLGDSSSLIDWYSYYVESAPWALGYRGFNNLEVDKLAKLFDLFNTNISWMANRDIIINTYMEYRLKGDIEFICKEIDGKIPGNKPKKNKNQSINLNGRLKKNEEKRNKFVNTFNEIDDKKQVIRDFLMSNTPETIKCELDKYIINQEEAKKVSATALYYHMMRCIYPNLPLRHILISGPSGCGKTEIWRVLAKLYGHLVVFKIFDVSTVTSEGWKGDLKFSTIINTAEKDNENNVCGPIVVLDEFDKLCSPQYSNTANVSLSIQGELLKSFEGEGVYGGKEITFICLGAFESIYSKKLNPGGVIGFNHEVLEHLSGNLEITIEDLIEFGVRPELVGRISSITTINALSLNDYLLIAKNKNSALRKTELIFEKFGIYLNISDEELKEMAQYSIDNKLGARNFIKQLENKLLDQLYAKGLSNVFADNIKTQDTNTVFIPNTSKIDRQN